MSGTQRFLDNCPVTPHIEGHKNADDQLTGFTVRMTPKYRIGPTPKPFTASATAVALPELVNGAHTDLVFQVAAAEYRKAKGAFRSDVLGHLTRAHPAPMPIDRLAELLVDEATDTSQMKSMKLKLRRHVIGAKGQVKPDLADFVRRDPYGDVVDPITFKMPAGWEPE